jgi:hypothetical protein
MQIKSLLNKPTTIVGGGYFFIDKSNGNKLATEHWFRTSDKACKYWVKEFKRNPNIAIKPTASLWDFLATNGYYLGGCYQVK